MVTITNGVKSFRVTAGGVEPFLNMGFRVASDEDVVEEEQKELHEDINTKESDVKQVLKNEEVEDSSEDEVFLSELLEKPLSQWSGEETKEFVRIKEIDTSGVKKLSQVKEIVKSYLEEQAKNA